MIIKNIGIKPYETVWQDMKNFTLNRTSETPDELWLLEHPPVYTQGQAGKPEHVLNPANIPIVQTDRGGQVTYHGPGQLVGYVLMDIKRQGIGIRTLVCRLEKILIDVLKMYSIAATCLEGAPGVYVDGAKIASIGLRVKNGCTYHGIALNIDMDLSPFKGINPCGYSQLAMTQINDFDDTVTLDDVALQFQQTFLTYFN